jgi:hypothetical protein
MNSNILEFAQLYDIPTFKIVDDQVLPYTQLELSFKIFEYETKHFGHVIFLAYEKSY